jgi:hypothetical protein
VNTFTSGSQDSRISDFFPDFSSRSSYHLETVPPEWLIEIHALRRIRLSDAPEGPLVVIDDISGHWGWNRDFEPDSLSTPVSLSNDSYLIGHSRCLYLS